MAVGGSAITATRQASLAALATALRVILFMALSLGIARMEKVRNRPCRTFIVHKIHKIVHNN
jgi:hypothetical protein